MSSSWLATAAAASRATTSPSGRRGDILLRAIALPTWQAHTTTHTRSLHRATPPFAQHCQCHQRAYASTRHIGIVQCQLGPVSVRADRRAKTEYRGRRAPHPAPRCPRAAPALTLRANHTPNNAAAYYLLPRFIRSKGWWSASQRPRTPEPVKTSGSSRARSYARRL